MVLTKISSDLEIQEALENIQHFRHLSEKKLVSKKNNLTFQSNLEIHGALENVQHFGHLSKKLVSNKNNCTDLEIHEAFENIQYFRHLSEKQNPVTAFLQGVQKPPENLK